MVIWSVSLSALVPVVTEGSSQQWPLVHNCLPCVWCPGSSCEIPVNACMHQRWLLFPRETLHCRLSATKRAFLRPGRAQSSSLPRKLLIRNSPVLCSGSRPALSPFPPLPPLSLESLSFTPPPSSHSSLYSSPLHLPLLPQLNFFFSQRGRQEEQHQRQRVGLHSHHLPRLCARAERKTGPYCNQGGSGRLLEAGTWVNAESWGGAGSTGGYTK